MWERIMEEPIPKASAEHALTKTCGAACKEAGAMIDEGVEKIQELAWKVVNKRTDKKSEHGKSKGGKKKLYTAQEREVHKANVAREERIEKARKLQAISRSPWVKLADAARRASKAAIGGEGIEKVRDGDWIALNIIMSGCVNEWEEKGKAAKGMDKRITLEMQRTQMGAALQMEAYIKANEKGRRWLQDREEAREYMRLIVRTWKEVSSEERKKKIEIAKTNEEIDGESGK